ncbi:MAG: ATP-binding cassette domain-containing protein [Firmicutes bacterium]|nr:ATP-binding cassette domain-containing protein [Bacillota bacterium]
MEKLVVRRLTKQDGKILIASDVGFTLHQGEIFALIGGISAGKSVIIKMILNLVHKTQGVVDLDNSALGVSIPGSYFNQSSTLIQILKSTARLNRVTIRKERLSNIMNMLGLKKISNRKIKELSPSQLARLKLAAALICPPKILVLDDAFKDLNEEGSFGVRVILKACAKELGVAVLVTSPSLRGIEEICDTFGSLEGGRLVDTQRVSSSK